MRLATPNTLGFRGLLSGPLCSRTHNSIVAPPKKKSEVLGPFECTVVLNDIAGHKFAFECEAERHHVREKIGTVKNPGNGLAL